MNPSFEQTLVEVWRQVLVEKATVVELSGRRYPVRTTLRKDLRQVDFIFDGNEIRGLEQNPQTKSRWAQLARSGKKVMQFLSDGPLYSECGGWEGDPISAATTISGDWAGPDTNSNFHLSDDRFRSESVSCVSNE